MNRLLNLIAFESKYSKQNSNKRNDFTALSWIFLEKICNTVQTYQILLRTDNFYKRGFG